MPTHDLAAALEASSGLVLVLTGAGISAASGIPTFRGPDPDAIWSRDITEIATYSFFRRDPVTSWRWYLARFGRLAQANPNAAHVALVAIEQHFAAAGRPFLLVTQNIDGLHRRAGSHALVEVHGRVDRVRCASVGCKHGAPRGSLELPAPELAAFEAAPSETTLPRCPACGDLLRPHVLWFDEYYLEHDGYGFGRVEGALDQLGLVLAVGTSFAVGITDIVLSRANWQGVPIWSIDPHARARAGVHHLAEPAETALPHLASELASQLAAIR